MRDFFGSGAVHKGVFVFMGDQSALIGGYLSMFRESESVQSTRFKHFERNLLGLLILADGSDRLYRNVGNYLTLTKRNVPEKGIPHRHIVTTLCACVKIQNADQNVSLSGWVVTEQTHGTFQLRCWYFWIVLQETSFKSLYRDLVSYLLCVLVSPHIIKASVWMNFIFC